MDKPKPPECRIHHVGLFTYFNGPESMFNIWRAQSLWSRICTSGVFRDNGERVK